MVAPDRLMQRLPFSALVLGAVMTGALSQESHVDFPVGCFHYGYQYTPEMTLAGNPFKLGSVQQCQLKCRTTQGCDKFGFFAKSQECWLAGSDAILAKAPEHGSISGPATCAEFAPACTEVPGPKFPGLTVEETGAAWPQTGEQPTNLECWPRKAGGFPTPCHRRMATVLEDTHAGWPGRCDMANFREITNLGPGETCQKRCFTGILCGVWMVDNTTTPGVDRCFHSMLGMNCYKPAGTGITPKRAQRVMHGSFRVLMNTMGIQIKGLTQAFEIIAFPNWEDGADRCRLTCLSYLFCQYWQYSQVYGCWIEDPGQHRVAYPLIEADESMNRTNGRSVKAGEYIQHTCSADLTYKPMPLDETIPVLPAEKPVGGVSNSTPVTPAVFTDQPSNIEETGGSYPIWAFACVAILVLAAIGAGVFFYFARGKDGRRRGDKRGFKNAAASSSKPPSFGTADGQSFNYSPSQSFEPGYQQGHYGQQGHGQQGHQPYDPYQQNQPMYTQPAFHQPFPQPQTMQAAAFPHPAQHPSYQPQYGQMPGTYQQWG